MLKGDKYRSGGAAMLAATLTMAPIDALWLTSRDKTDRTAQTTTFELLGCTTHNSDPRNYLAKELRHSQTTLHLAATDCAWRQPLAASAIV